MKLFNLFTIISLLVAKILADSASCKKVTKEYENCIVNFNSVNFDAMCNEYATAKCQDLFNRPKEILKGCDADFINKTTKVFTGMTNVLKYTCARDEYGHYCPLSTIIQKTQTSSSSSNNISEIFSGLKDSCSSKNCLKVSVAYLKSVKSMATKNGNVSKNDIKAIESLIADMNKCSSNGSSSSNKSKTTTSTTFSESISQKSDENEITTSVINGNNTISIDNNVNENDVDTTGVKSTINAVPVNNNSTVEESNSPNTNTNSVPVGGDAQGNISDNDITIYDQNGNAVGSSNGLAQSSDSQSKINVSISVIALTIIASIIF